MVKICNTCGVGKNLKEFNNCQQGPDGKSHYCKTCTKAYSDAYRIKNKDKLNKQCRENYNRNTLKINKRRRVHYKKYKEEVLAKQRGYYRKNKQKVLTRTRNYHRNKPIEARQMDRNRDKEAYNSTSNISGHKDSLPKSDNPRMVKGILTVVCTKCGTRFSPTRGEIKRRVAAFTHTDKGQANFYCSDECKGSCVLFNFNTYQDVDPRSELYGKDNKARSCQTDHLKQLQCDEFGYNYCERCGDIVDVELHHTQTVQKGGRNVITSAGHILLCIGCHREVQAGC